MDLSQYTAQELLKISNDIDAEVKRRSHEEKENAKNEILAIAQRLGVPLSTLLPNKIKSVKPTSKPVAQQYRNKDNHEQTWSGRGRAPRWVKVWTDAGNQLSDLKI